MSSLLLPVRAVVRAVLAAALVAAFGLVLAVPALAQDPDTPPSGPDAPTESSGSTIEVLPVQGLLDPPVANRIMELLDGAAERDSDLVIIQVDGPGGVSVDVAELADAVESSTVPVAVMVAPNQSPTASAAGAWGVLWALADIRIMSQFGAVGPLDPVELTEESTSANDDVLGRAMTALDRDSTPGMAQRLLDEAVDGLALDEAGLVDVLADSYLEAADQLNGAEVEAATGTVVLELGEGTTTRLSDLGLLARMLHAAATPTFIYLLLVVGLSMLAFELFQPGFGVAGFAGLVMLPFAVFGLTILPVEPLWLGLLLLGIALFVVDTSIAGFGVVTLAATVSFFLGSQGLFGAGDLRVPLWVAGFMTFAALAFWVVIMTTILRAQAGPEGVELDDLVGKLGIVRSVLNPEGHVYIDDALWRARLDGQERLRVSAPIRVVAVDGAVLVVEPYVASPATAAATD